MTILLIIVLRMSFLILRTYNANNVIKDIKMLIFRIASMNVNPVLKILYVMENNLE